MPHLYFHLRDGVDFVPDNEGRTIDDPETVAMVALQEARGMISAEATQGRILLDPRIEVTDASGAIVHRLQFVDAVVLKLPAGWPGAHADG